MGDLRTFAQSLHLAPTGPWTRQRGQMGVSQLWQRRAVSTPGSRGQVTTVVTAVIVGRALRSRSSALPRSYRDCGKGGGAYQSAGASASTRAKEMSPSAARLPSTEALTCPLP